uniref:Thiopurine S-methyltransferase n=1 Tax=Oncorhynchus mykiss TaxID=8022 RepID=A0A8K9V584_ONCMY
MEAQAYRVRTLGEWEQGWKEGEIGSHMLESYIDKVLCELKGVRFFFPLCGKAVDMKWLVDMGHPVVGVDIAEMGIRHVFEMSGI